MSGPADQLVLLRIEAQLLADLILQGQAFEKGLSTLGYHDEARPVRIGLAQLTVRLHRVNAAIAAYHATHPITQKETTP